MKSQTKSQRQLQVGEHIKRIVSEIFLREGLLTINKKYITILEADISPDMKNVRIYIDIFGGSNDNENIVNYLNNAAPRFRHELGKKLSLRSIPEINFVLDRTEENALKLEDLILKESISFTKQTRKKK